MPPTYRERLRLEGAWLAACGVVGSALLLATTEEAKRWPLNTVGQVVVAGGLAATLGPRVAKKAMASAEDHTPDQIGDGEPTPLWMHPLIVAGLTGLVSLPRELGAPGAGWDAGLRVTAGCALVGLTQALIMERLVAADEQAKGRTYYRFKGSRGARTVLAAVKR